MTPRQGEHAKDAVMGKRVGAHLIILLLIFVLWVVLAVWGVSERQRQVEVKEADLRQVTVAAAEQTLRMFKLTEMSLLSAADWLQRNPDTYPGMNPDFITLIEHLRHFSDDLIVYRYVDPDGNLYPIPTKSRAAIGNVAGRGVFQIQRDPQNRGFHISDPVISSVNRKWVIPTTFPAVRGGRVSVIAGVVELDRIIDLFETQRLGQNGSITLFKTDGTTLFRAPMIEGVAGRSIADSKDFTEHLNLSDRGIFHAAGAFDGVERIVSFEKLDEYGLIVATTTSMEDALLDWRREAWAFGTYAAIATILIVVLIHRFLAAAQSADIALRNREWEIRTILDTSSVGILFMDRDSRIIRANTRLAEMLACPLEELIGSRYLDALSDTDRDAAAAEIKARFDGTDGISYRDRQYFRRDGTRFWGSLASRLMTTDRGEPLGLVAIVTDITDQRQMIEVLQNSEQRFRRAVEEAPFPVMIHIDDGTVLTLSRTWSDITGYARNDIPTIADWTEKAYGKRRRMTPDEIEARYTVGLRRDEGEYTVHCRSGDTRVWDIFSVGLGEMPDGRRAAISMAVDVSERKRAEEALEQRSLELAASNAELEQFAYVANHDLREPLRMVSSYMDLLSRRHGAVLNEEAREFLEFARDGAKRMDQLVLGLLDLSRIDRRGTPMVAMPLAPAINDALIDLGARIEETGATISVDQTIEPVVVMGDSIQITSLFQNLIGNAIKYAADDRPPHITVTGARHGGAWEIRVADNGIGIEACYFDRIFGIFQRLHTRDQYGGTGIGLAICKKIVERHGGHIWVESVPGEGSTFLFTLKDGATEA